MGSGFYVSGIAHSGASVEIGFSDTLQEVTVDRNRICSGVIHDDESIGYHGGVAHR
uniref:Uncharacterized protein n=1 Tax=Candidatus Kentrum sp. TC TaxID=2126339 RepID=A0A450Y9T8_9GAMM|nr:MAG: hypothetical protein BECKTC1821E_GA0114239_100234 [Candidatus Kentron sp. TC]VFK53177.1 MAG: hypothetical protein BECKTC1821F_GA0114240_100233 [Candidatus Kentron sp. TC]